MNTRLLFGLLWLTPTLCFGALSTTTSYFLNVEALTNVTARSAVRGLTGAFTNGITSGASTFTGQINTTSVFVDGTSLSPLRQATITHAGTLVADFTATNVFSMAATGNVTIATANLQTNRTWRVKILAPATNITVTLPSWISLGTGLTTVLANKTVMLSAEAWGTTDGSVVYAAGVQP